MRKKPFAVRLAELCPATDSHREHAGFFSRMVKEKLLQLYDGEYVNKTHQRSPVLNSKSALQDDIYKRYSARSRAETENSTQLYRFVPNTERSPR